MSALEELRERSKTAIGFLSDDIFGSGSKTTVAILELLDRVEALEREVAVYRILTAADAPGHGAGGSHDRDMTPEEVRQAMADSTGTGDVSHEVKNSRGRLQIQLTPEEAARANPGLQRDSAAGATSGEDTRKA